jgi:hypothetical protein
MNFGKKEVSDSVNQLADDLQRMKRRIRELEGQLADCRNGKLPADQYLDPDILSVESIVSSKTGEGMVMIRWFTHISQLAIEDAREMAFTLLEACEFAKSDAFLVEFLKERIKINDPEAICRILLEFRNFGTRGEKP